MKNRAFWRSKTRPLLLFVLLAAGLAVDVHRRQGPAWPAPPAAPRVVGSWHLHGHDSHDSRIPPARWAAAAAERGLNFLVLTDHDSQERKPWAEGSVLVLPQAELTTPGGHLIGFGSHLLPLPEERRSADIVARLAERGVAPIAAHPASPKRPWVGGPAYLAGVEPANLSAAFDQTLRTPALWGRLLALPLWPLNPRLVLSQFYHRDARALALWDALPPPALGPCGGDGHGWMDLGLNLSAWHVVLEDVAVAAVGEADATSAAPAAETVANALLAGHFHSVVGLWQREVGFGFAAHAADGTVVATGGDNVAARGVHLRTCVGEGAPAALELRLLRDGVVVARSRARCLTLPAPAPGGWRVEAWAKLPSPWGGSREVPVLYSNRITLRPEPAASAGKNVSPSALQAPATAAPHPRPRRW